MTEKQRLRYDRHIRLEGFGEAGQERLLKAKVLIVGAGGLGSPCALYLAAAGVGTIGIADADVVSLSNLQRQVIHASKDEGRLKAESAAEKMTAINPEVKVVTYPYYINKENATELFAQYDFIVECTDSFESKYLINDVCVELGKPFCIAGIVKYSGQMMTHVPGSMTYRDIFAEIPTENVEKAATVGVLGSAVGTMGTLQATEVIKYLTGIGLLLTNRMLLFDALTMSFMSIECEAPIPNPSP